MKLTHITVQNYLGARAVDLPVTAPVLLVAGKNGAGKSSVQEAVRHALSGDAARVSLKKEFRALITEGADAGFATVTTDSGERSIVLPSGKGVHQDHPALPFVLDPSRFARLGADERRQLLFGLFGLAPDGESVLVSMRTRGADMAKFDQVRPLLRAGFDAAAKEAQAKARDAKAAWKTVTGGETWGKEKANTWKAPKPTETYDREQVKTAENLLAETDAEIEAANQKIGELRNSAKQRAEAEDRVADLSTKAARLPSLREKLARDEAEHAEWAAKLAALPPSGGKHQKTLGCPCCGAALMADQNGELVPYQLPENGALDEDLEAKRKQQQDAVDLFARSVANDRRDIAAAEYAAAEIEAAEKILAETSPGYTTAAEDRLVTLKADRKARAATLEAMCAANRTAQAADELTKKAAGYHADVLAWLLIADALSPDGIPAELLSAALQPINDSLTASASDAEWTPIRITEDMQIVQVLESTNYRSYTLLSESEKWRADALIGAAIAELSSLRLLVLDRFDVLDAKGREDALYWLDGMAQDGKLDSCLIFGTLKALPSGLPETIQPVWIEAGAAGEIREAA